MNTGYRHLDRLGLWLMVWVLELVKRLFTNWKLDLSINNWIASTEPLPRPNRRNNLVPKHLTFFLPTFCNVVCKVLINE